MWSHAGRKRIIIALRNLARLDAKSATNSPYQFVASTIANCIFTAMKLHGGPGSVSTWFRSRSNLGATHAPAPVPPALFFGLSAVTPLHDAVSDFIR